MGCPYFFYFFGVFRLLGHLLLQAVSAGGAGLLFCIGEFGGGSAGGGCAAPGSPGAGGHGRS